MIRLHLLTKALVIGLVLMLMGCAGKAERPTPTATPTAVVVAPTPGARPQLTPAPEISGEIPTGLFLQITNLPKESVVRTNAIAISGATTPDALVSVNGVLVDVDQDGKFTSTLTLQEGPNIIEVVASDFQGNKVSAVLSIISIP